MERGKLEKSFAAIGTSLGVGAVSGAIYGLFDGIRHTANSDLTGNLRRTQIINHTIKSSEFFKKYIFSWCNIIVILLKIQWDGDFKDANKLTLEKNMYFAKKKNILTMLKVLWVAI